MDKGNRPVEQPVQKRSLSLLLVEPSPEDAELCLLALAAMPTKICCDVVKEPEEFVDRIRSTSYDVILSDYSLGNWTGLDTLELMRNEGHDIPLILVTGSLGEQKAVECMRNGAADYVLKDHLERLPQAIFEALEEKELRDQRRRAERALRESEERFHRLVEAIPMAAFIEQGTRCCYANRAAESITEYRHEELLTMNFWQLIDRESKDAIVRKAAAATEGNRTSFRHEMKIITKNDKVRCLDVTVGMFQLDGGLAALITAFDVTERKHREFEIHGSLGSHVPMSVQRCGHL
jgi:PAS domain S-box-containing protein